jgi:LuxR family transcriptional regulator, maltose regulon positive regulatory protein
LRPLPPLIAKLTRPTLRDLEPRPRLFQRLDQLRHEGPAVWIGAPAGSGKTALVLSYIEQHELPVLWYRVDERDHHVAELFFYLRLAAEALEGGPSGSIELPVFSESVELPRFARRFFEALFLRMPSGGLLVFDDYHTAHVGPQWQAAFERCLASIPQGLNVVAISRHSPPPALARAIAHRELGVLESSELLLTEPETAALAKRRTRKKLRRSSEEVTRIHAATSGWAAGVSLLLRSNQDAALPEFSTRTIEPIFDYLTTAVFSEFSPNTQTLLLHSACLRRFAVRELEELAGLTADRTELLSLYRSGFFLESDGPGEEDFRFHALFRSFLTFRAEQVLGASELRSIRARAARMLRADGRVEEAFELLVSIDDQPALCELVSSIAPTLFAQGRTAMLGEWLRALDQDAVAESGWLSHWQASCLLLSEPSRSLEIFGRALSNFERENDGEGAYQAWAGAVQAVTYEQRSYQVLEHWLERLTRIERLFPAFVSPEVGAAVVSSLLMGLSMSGAETSVIEQWIARAVALAERAGDPSVRVMAASVLVLNFALRGDSGLASIWLATLQRHTESGPMALIGQVAARAAATALAWRQGQLAAGVAAAREGLELLGSQQVPMWQSALLVFGSLAAIDAGANVEAERFMARFGELANTCTGLEVSGYHFVRACHALSRGELRQALLLTELSVDRDRAVGFSYGQSVELQVAAYLHFELGDEASGREALREAHAMEEAHRHPVLRHWRLLIEADRALKAGDSQRALPLLRSSFSIGRELELYNAYCPPPARMAEICRIALAHDVEPEYARTLVRRKDLFRHATPIELSAWPWPIRIRTLGSLDVLLEDQPLALGRARMPLQLLRLLVAETGGRGCISVPRVVAALWPEADGDNAMHSFEMTLLRLRNQLGEQGRRALRVERGHVLLDAGLCWTDTAALGAVLADIASLQPETADSRAQLGHSLMLAERLERLYLGPFAEEDDAVSALVAYGRKLRARVAGTARALGAYLAQLGEAARAEALYVRLLEVDPLLDALLAPALKCLLLSDRAAEARALFEARLRRGEPLSAADLAEAENALKRR